MKCKSMEDSPCSVARTLDVIGDWWSLLIVRDALNGLTDKGRALRTVLVALSQWGEYLPGCKENTSGHDDRE